MNIKDFNEALYALSNGVVVERRKRTIIPFAILLAGIAMLVANLFVESNDYTDNLKSALILFGGLITIVGVAYSAVSIFGGGDPYFKRDECFLEHRQYSFNREQYNMVVNAVEKCDKSTLDTLVESDIAGIVVLCYYSPKSNYCAMQAFIYEGYAYQSITKIYDKA